MISMPPSERDLHAYVDHQLNDDDRRLVETFLAGNVEMSAQVRAWQQDAQQLRAASAAHCSNRPTRTSTRR